MASLIVRYPALTASRALTSRAILSTKSTTFANRSWTVASRRCFSQTLRRPEKRYTESHEWVDVSADRKTCKLGISRYAADALGDVVYVELPEAGEEVSEGEPFGSVESVKSASDIVSAVSGTVTAVNDPIVEKPADLGKDPEGEGWLLEVQMSDVSGVESLMDGKAYAEFTSNL